MHYSSCEYSTAKAIFTGLLLVVGIVFVANLPELRRYLLIRSM
jgi:hypothetical protein